MLFVAVEAVPGEAVGGGIRRDLPRSEVERIRKLRGLDQGPLARYRCWLLGVNARGCEWWTGGQGILQGDLGTSTRHGRPVRELLAERLPRTLSVMLPAFMGGLFLAVVLGAVAARAPGGRWDRILSTLALFGHGVPLHWLGLLAILAFSLQLQLLPSSGTGSGWLGGFRHALLPILVTALYFAGRWLRLVRAAVVDAARAPFVVGLQARGVTGTRLLARVARSALVPVLSAAGHALPTLFGGAVIIERVFVYPGMGTLLVESVLEKDHLTATVLLVAYSGLTLLAAASVDATLFALDPRLRDPSLDEDLG